MRLYLKRFVFSLTLLCLLGCQEEGVISVKILDSADGALRHTFKAELALTTQERTQGLMFRKELGKDRGMLFVFPTITETAFWMQNTLIPLDIIFIDQEKHILSMVENATPQTTTPREPAGPYQYVLEIEGGRAAALGIQPGDVVNFQLPPPR